MNFDINLNGKILDPIHGTIMITDVERAVIGHRLFQRLRNVKQNTFLYKVFPSAMHSRFEHSLGVMHIAYKMLSNLLLNSYRYNNKYHDKLIFNKVEKIDNKHIQELRLAALLHDIGHGPMSHQFDSFLMNKSQLRATLGESFTDVYDLIKNDDGVEHEHISVIFIKKIIKDLKLENDVNVENIIKLIESSYMGGVIEIEIDDHRYNIQPLFTSLISSCPIDSDRMDYLLRDSYFSGVKCGIYNVERILMSIVPIIDDNKICLAYKESCLDSISEFIFSRSNLFSQVYYHKTNRAFSAMLGKVCKHATDKGKEYLMKNMYEIGDDSDESNNLDILQEFYLDNSDDEFINETVPKLVQDDKLCESIINDIVDRKPWKKLYESKLYESNKKIHDSVDKTKVTNIKNSFTQELRKHLDEKDFIIDIMTDNAFKDLDKTEIKLLTKLPNGEYKSRPITECSDKLDIYQCIRYFIRVFVNPEEVNDEIKKVTSSLEKIKNQLI